jgi:hypothetical protein
MMSPVDGVRVVCLDGRSKKAGIEMQYSCRSEFPPSAELNSDWLPSSLAPVRFFKP